MFVRPKVIVWLFVAVLIYAFTILSPQERGLNSIELKGEFLDGRLPRLPGALWKLTNTFPNFSIDPLTTNLKEIPGTDKLLVLGKNGTVWMLDNDEANGEPQMILDISYQVVGTGDVGLLGVAFHPDFSDATGSHYGEVYFFYAYRFEADEPLYNRLTRFKFSANLDSIIPSSEEVLIQQYDRNGFHSGGDLFFDKEGYLYVSLGDEGGGYDPYRSSQKINVSLFSGIIRIDVDLDSSRSHPIRRYPRPPHGKPAHYPDNINQHYMIPNDNPWVDESGKNLEEFFAIGLRSPHRMHYDTLTENIWVADVGQEAREEISLITKGSNAQWVFLEGTLPHPHRLPDSVIGIETPPIFDYGRSWGGCIIGGFVYRGDKHPTLKGKYVFGDYVSKNIWVLDPEQENQVTLLCKVIGASPVSFLNSADGHVYVLTLDGKILRLDEVEPQEFPKLLSQTEAFADLKDMTPSPGIVPYRVNTPLWSDGALKKRWISVPKSSGGIVYSSDSTWEFPVGTVFIKHFELPVSQDSVTRLETRFFVIDENKQGYGITYKWNAQGTDAELIDEGELISEEINVLRDELVSSQTWTFPSRAQCMDCHNQNAGYVLGVKTAQLNRPFFYEQLGTEGNQVQTWNRLGLFGKDLDHIDPSELTRLVSVNDTSASLQARVRSYLDANCSFCHRPGGVEAAFDARSNTPLPFQSLVNGDVVSRNSTVGNKIIMPHSPDSSELWLRDKSLGEDKMPPIGRNKPDQDYLNVLEEWIMSLQSFSSTQQDTVCYGDSYTFADGEVLTDIEASTTHTSYLISSQGTDSLITTSLAVDPQCYYVAVNAHVCSGESYSLGPDNLTEAGEYTRTFTTDSGTDSTVMLNLRVVSIDTTLTLLDTALVVNHPWGVYQWVDCDAGNAEIEGETDSLFVPAKSGNYCVRITTDSCSVLSEAKAFDVKTVTGIEKNDFGGDLKVYPNPTEGQVVVSFGDNPFSGSAELVDLSGKRIWHKTFFNRSEFDIDIGKRRGAYVLNLVGNRKTAVVKVIKK
jgi:uncharacterized repeat protein (TIGR03806 family)